VKISLYTVTLNGGFYDGPAVPLLEMFPLARSWGYDGIEIEAKRPHGSPLDLDAAARDRIRQVAVATGVEVSCIAAHNDFSSPIEEHRENELLMTRELIRLAVELGAPIVRVFAAWSGVTRRDGRLTYDVARHNLDSRYPGTTDVEKWGYVRECLGEAARMAEDAGITLALQNHTPIITNYRQMLDFIDEVDSPALKACLDPPLMEVHTEERYREAIEATGDRIVHTHYGGQFVRDAAGNVTRRPGVHYPADDALFVRIARDVLDYRGHIGYELCSPVLVGHRHANLEYALEQAELASLYMRQIIDSL